MTIVNSRAISQPIHQLVVYNVYTYTNMISDVTLADITSLLYTVYYWSETLSPYILYIMECCYDSSTMAEHL